MPTEAHLENCMCPVLGNKAPCGWCENGGDSCRTCRGEGEVPMGFPTPGRETLFPKTKCTDCAGTGIDPQYHDHGCECTACDPDFREVDPEPVIIGIDMGKEPAAVAVSEPDCREWPEISERYLKMMRKKSADAFFRKQLFQDWTPARVADLPNHAADALAYMARAYEAIRSTTGLDRQTELELRRLEGQRQHEQEKRDAYLIEKYGPKTSVPRICGWKREDRQEPATVHELSDDIGQLPVALPDHRMGWKP